jgi:heptosyltransferase-2
VNRDQRTILVVGPSWVGDMVMAQALYIALERQDDVHAVDVVAPPGGYAILERIPEVRERFLLEVRHGRLDLAVRWSLARSLRSRRYDQAYVLPSSFKSALLPFLAGIPKRTAYRGELRFGFINDVRQPVDHPLEKNVRGYLGLLEAGTRPDAVPRPRLRVDSDNQLRLFAAHDLDTDTPAAALAPGAAFGPAKRWPVQRFQELARRLSDAGKQVWVLGGKADRQLGDTIVEGLKGPVRNLCGRTTLPDAVDLLALARVTVSNDSGLMHVAAAAGSAVVGLFGPTSPDFAPPLTDHAEVLYRTDLPTRSSPLPARHHGGRGHGTSDPARSAGHVSGRLTGRRRGVSPDVSPIQRSSVDGRQSRRGCVAQASWTALRVWSQPDNSLRRRSPVASST